MLRPWLLWAGVSAVAVVFAAPVLFGYGHTMAPDRALRETPVAHETEVTGNIPPAAPGRDQSNRCAGQGREILVSIGRRKLWACARGAVRYRSPVVTGIESIAADLTPVGEYHVFGKQRKVYLSGSDSTGSWHDYVHFWMPFLTNQYGTYGLHDATW